MNDFKICFFILNIFISFVFSSCNQTKINRPENDLKCIEKIFEDNYLLNYDYKKIIKEKYGVAIELPDSLKVLVNGKVNIINKNSLIRNADNTVLGFIFGDCHVCIHDLNKWQELIDEKLFPNTQFIFIVMTNDIQYFIQVLYPLLKYRGQLIFDTNGKIVSLNKVPVEHIELNFYMLDNSFKVRIIGNPILFDKLMDLYVTKDKSTISK